MEKKEKVYIIGAHNLGSVAIAEAMKQHQDVMVVNSLEDIRKEDASIPYTRQPQANYLSSMPTIRQNLGYCPGRHTYKNIGGKWTCKCGKDL